ncbi:MAG: histidine phosphatase family protein, partial [Burkholderiales bacterium]|nr:histidine phosphatase family protein [Burkholderiales bacterium]
MSNFRLTLLRHGATVAPKGMLIGHTDLPLSALGEQQLASRNDHFARFPPSSISSSDLGRCAGFARQLAAMSGLDCHIDRNLREMNFGELDGLAKTQWSEQQQAAWALWSHNPEENTAVGIESWV